MMMLIIPETRRVHQTRYLNYIYIVSLFLSFILQDLIICIFTSSEGIVLKTACQIMVAVHCYIGIAKLFHRLK